MAPELRQQHTWGRCKKQNLGCPYLQKQMLWGRGLENTEGPSPQRVWGTPQAEVPAPEERDRPSSSLSIHLQRGLFSPDLEVPEPTGQSCSGTIRGSTRDRHPSLAHLPPSGPARTPGTGRGTHRLQFFPAREEAQHPVERLGGSVLQKLLTEATDSPSPPDSSMPRAPGIT